MITILYNRLLSKFALIEKNRCFLSRFSNGISKDVIYSASRFDNISKLPYKEAKRSICLGIISTKSYMLAKTKKARWLIFSKSLAKSSIQSSSRRDHRVAPISSAHSWSARFYQNTSICKSRSLHW